MKRILCFFGWHRWLYHSPSGASTRDCIRCKQHEVRVWWFTREGILQTWEEKE